MTNGRAVDIGLNLAALQGRINAACGRSGRSLSEITLVAVSKTQTVETVEAAYQAGLRLFGENRIEEAIPKIQALRQRLPAGEESPAWHLIGHLQSRKAPLVNGHFCCLHSVDSLHLAQKLDHYLSQGAHPPLPVLLECNVSGEESKYGFNLRQWESETSLRRAFWQDVGTIAGLPCLRLGGLMTMAPLSADAERARPVFAALRRLRTALANDFPQFNWTQLSMGMTDDFEIAIEEGATLIRIGRAIFGERPAA